MSDLTLRKAIEEVQRVGEKHGFSIAIVGGAFVRNISNGVKIQSIDSKHNAIYLSSTANPGIKREEDARTTIDIDAIAFSKEENPFHPTIKEKFEQLLKELRTLEQSDKSFPTISIEPVFYHPIWKKPNTLFQFVSSVEKFPHQPKHFIFRLGSIKQSVEEDSLQVWTYVFLDTKEQLTSLLPQALQLRYAIRGFSIKPKDKEKIWGKYSPFAQFVKDFQEKTNGKYDRLFGEWKLFEEQVQSTQNPSTKIKRELWNLYWGTIGTYLAHGTGLIGKLLLPLGNTFFAGK